ncbi:class I SAM-dependent methyltransferase [Jatrophihabitans sp. DSM 45814]
MADGTNRWAELTGGSSGAKYAARIDALAADGRDMHGEANFCRSLVNPGARILDAGCGTGRVSIRLAELGFDCVGADADASMLAVARDRAPQIAWYLTDLEASWPLSSAGIFDLVVAAGNVIPLLRPGSLGTVVTHLAARTKHGGWLVAGFGLDAGHLPPGCPVTPLADYDEACSEAGLTEVATSSTWDGAAFDPRSGYVVRVHRKPKSA